MALGPIPRSAIRNYAAEFDLAGDRLEQFQRIIRMMDNEYLSLTNSSQKGDQVAKTVSATDREGVAQLFDKLQNRARKAKPKAIIRKH